jgi:site-specific recombinase XerD
VRTPPPTHEQNTVLDAHIAGFLEHLVSERGLSPNTLRAYERDLRHWTMATGATDLEDLAPERLERYLIALARQGDLAPASVSRRRAALAAFCRYLVLEGRLEVSPLDRVEGHTRPERRLPHFLTPDEIARLLDAPDRTTPRGRRDAALLELMYASGLRVSEVVALRRSDVDSARGLVRVRRGKGDKERLVPVAESALRAVVAYLNDGGPHPPSPVLLSPSGGEGAEG